jgi:hypothetical protein
MGYILELSFFVYLSVQCSTTKYSQSFKHISIFETQIILLGSNVKFKIFILRVV